jgi:hypothetical protein
MLIGKVNAIHIVAKLYIVHCTLCSALLLLQLRRDAICSNCCAIGHNSLSKNACFNALVPCMAYVTAAVFALWPVVMTHGTRL